MSDKGIKYLLEKLSTKFGIIDFKQPIQTSFLFSLMQDLEVPVHLIQETISKLTEDDKEKKKRAKIAKQKKLKSTGWNNYEDSAGNTFTWSDERQDIVPIGDKSDDTDKKSSKDNQPTGTPPPKKPEITTIPDNPMDKKSDEEKKLTKTQIKINDTINKLGIGKKVLDRVDESFKKDFNSIINQVSKNIDKLDDTSKQIVTETINSISVLYSKASDEDKVKVIYIKF